MGRIARLLPDETTLKYKSVFRVPILVFESLADSSEGIPRNPDDLKPRESMFGQAKLDSEEEITDFSERSFYHRSQ